MANVINATSTGNGGLITTGDDSGVLNIQTNETTAVSIDASQNVDFTNNIDAPNTFGFKNRLINGLMAINQRGSSSYTSNGYTLDRWTIYNSGGTFTVAQQTVTPGSQPFQGANNYVRLTRSSPSGILYFTQKIEDVSNYDNVTVTVSFWAKANTSITLPIRLVQEFGSGGSTAVTVGSSDKTITTSWAKYTATFACPSLAGKTIGTSSYLECTFDTPTTYSTLDITGVQLEVGTQATSFDFRSYGTELALCQRYYETISGYNSCYSNGLNGMSCGVYFKVTKRASPTTAFASTYAIVNWTSPAIGASTIEYVEVTQSVASSTGFARLGFSLTISAEL